MNVLFDTSVVVAAVLPQHPSHYPCFIQLRAAKLAQLTGYLSTHSLAELYSVLTRMPSQPRISPQDAKRLIENNLKYLETVVLDQADYQAAIAQMTALSLPGGGIFHALIAQAALKVSAERLLTLNPKHFTRLGTELAQIVYVP